MDQEAKSNEILTELLIAKIKILQESESRYQRLMDAVSDFIYTVTVSADQSVKTIYWGACEAVTGYTAEEMQTDHDLWINMVHKDDQHVVNDQIFRLFTHGEPGPIEHRIIRKDGVIRWVRNTPAPHYGEKGKLISYEGVVRDITEYKDAQVKKNISEERYHRLFDTMTEGVVVVDDTGAIIQANHAAENILRMGSDFLLNRRFMEPGDRFYHHDGSPMQEGETPLVVARRENRIVSNVVVGVEILDGSTIWLNLNASPIHFENDMMANTLVTFSDITALIEIDKEQHRLQTELQDSLTKVLSGYLTVCASCKNIRTEDGKWVQIESYIHDHTDAEFSHGICPRCGVKLYGSFFTEFQEQTAALPDAHRGSLMNQSASNEEAQHGKPDSQSRNNH